MINLLKRLISVTSSAVEINEGVSRKQIVLQYDRNKNRIRLGASVLFAFSVTCGFMFSSSNYSVLDLLYSDLVGYDRIDGIPSVIPDWPQAPKIGIKSAFFLLSGLLFWWLFRFVDPISNPALLAALRNHEDGLAFFSPFQNPISPLCKDLEKFAVACPSARLEHLCGRCRNRKKECASAVDSRRFIQKHSVAIWEGLACKLGNDDLSALYRATLNCRALFYLRLSIFFSLFAILLIYAAHRAFEAWHPQLNAVFVNPGVFALIAILLGVFLVFGAFHDYAKFHSSAGGVWGKLESKSEAVFRRQCVRELEQQLYVREVCKSHGGEFEYVSSKYETRLRSYAAQSEVLRALLLSLDDLVTSKLIRVALSRGADLHSLEVGNHVVAPLEALVEYFRSDFPGGAPYEYWVTIDLASLFVRAAPSEQWRMSELVRRQISSNGVFLMESGADGDFDECLGNSFGSIAIAPITLSQHHRQKIADASAAAGVDELFKSFEGAGYFVLTSADRGLFNEVDSPLVALLFEPFVHRAAVEAARNGIV